MRSLSAQRPEVDVLPLQLPEHASRFWIMLLLIPASLKYGVAASADKEVVLGVRPERTTVSPDGCAVVQIVRPQIL